MYRIQRHFDEVITGSSHNGNKLDAYQYRAMQIPPNGWVNVTNLCLGDAANFIATTSIPLDDLELAIPISQEFVEEFGDQIRYHTKFGLDTPKAEMEKSWMLGIWRKPSPEQRRGPMGLLES